jgi:hypothetical protein
MMEGEVWALDLLPVVQKQPAGKAGRPDTFSDDQLRLLVELREVRRMQWGKIAEVMNRPLKSCHRRYAQIVAERRADAEPHSLSAAAPSRKPRLHEELGIRTFTVVKKATITCPRDGGFAQFEKTMLITLSAGIALR